VLVLPAADHLKAGICFDTLEKADSVAQPFLLGVNTPQYFIYNNA
jgi:hypothetical protein